jgi:hypothetical protein
MAVLGPGPGPVRVFVAVFTAVLAVVVVPVVATWGRLAHASQGAGKARLQHLDNSHPDAVATRSRPGSDRPPWLGPSALAPTSGLAQTVQSSCGSGMPCCRPYACAWARPASSPRG